MLRLGADARQDPLHPKRDKKILLVSAAENSGRCHAFGWMHDNTHYVLHGITLRGGFVEARVMLREGVVGGRG